MAEKKWEETDGNDAGCALPPVHSRYRACLFVSLIVLVWNVGATGRHFFSADQLSKEPVVTTVRSTASPSPAIMVTDCVVSSLPGPLNVRQNFLIGRKVDINRAGSKEISALPGISDRVAGSVVETRNRIGGFRRPEDLLMVKGIKGKKLKKILPFLSGFHNN